MNDHPVFARFEAVASTTTGEHIFDFVGSATRVAFKRGWEKHALPSGRIIFPNVPIKNEHYLDWIGLLRAVDRASGTFRMAELGAGWAPWLVRAALASRQNAVITGTELLAVEADTTHYNWIGRHFEDNGLNPTDHHVLHGAVAGMPGILRFPVVEDPDVNYGASLAQSARAAATIEVRAWTIPEILNTFTGHVDFLHVDIQGSEYGSLSPAMDLLKERVRSIMVGTHTSDALHDGLVAQLKSAGWDEVLNLSRNRTHNTLWGEIAVNDGFLLYDNPGL